MKAIVMHTLNTDKMSEAKNFPCNAMQKQRMLTMVKNIGNAKIFQIISSCCILFQKKITEQIRIFFHRLSPEKMSKNKPLVLQMLTTLNMGGAERIAVFILGNEKDKFSGIIGAMYGENGDLAILADSFNIPYFNLQAASCGRLKTIWRLYRILKKCEINIIQTHAAYLLNYVVPAAKLAGIPVVYTAHSIFELQQFPNLRRTIRFSSPFISCISCINQPIADYLKESVGIKKKIHIIENGVDLDEFAPKNSNNALADTPWTEINDSDDDKPLFIFGTVARLCMEKDHPNMLKAFSIVHARHPEARLLIIGDGVEREKTQTLIDELNLSGVVHISGKTLDIAERLRSFDVFVMSSKHEGLPMVILEAMACKIPVVTTDAGDIASLNAKGEHVLLVPKEQHEELANAMEQMLLNSDLREEYSQRALDYVRKEKSAKKMSEDYYTMFSTTGLIS